jgi:phosphoglycolate phosphatase
MSDTTTSTLAAALWDFDGTLADTFAGILTSADVAVVAHGLPAVDAEALRGVVGLSLTTAFVRLLAGGDRETEPPPDLVADVVASYREAYQAHGATQVTLFPGMADLLDDLAAARIPSAIATSKSRRGVEAALATLGLTERFAAAVTDDDVADKKPAPEMVLTACRTVGVPPEQALVIGDTVFDIEKGQRAGAHTVGVTWGNQSRAQLATQRPHHLVDSVPVLRSLLLAAL